MRTIKFRAWYPEENRLEYQDGKTPIWLGDILTDDDYVPMQFTGMVDSNGKEIYEGDIVKGGRSFFDVPIGVIAFEGMAFCIRGTTIAGELWHFTVTNKNKSEIDVEIIGNIYENPDLIK